MFERDDPQRKAAIRAIYQESGTGQPRIENIDLETEPFDFLWNLNADQLVSLWSKNMLLLKYSTLNNEEHPYMEFFPGQPKERLNQEVYVFDRNGIIGGTWPHSRLERSRISRPRQIVEDFPTEPFVDSSDEAWDEYRRQQLVTIARFVRNQLYDLNQWHP